MYIYIYKYIRMYLYIYTYIYVYIQVNTGMYICSSIYKYTYMCVYIYICIYIYIYPHLAEATAQGGRPGIVEMHQLAQFLDGVRVGQQQGGSARFNHLLCLLCFHATHTPHTHDEQNNQQHRVRVSYSWRQRWWCVTII